MTLTWTPRERMPRQGERDGEYHYDADLAELPVRWFEKQLRLPEGDRYGAPFRPEEWQANFLRALYGWRTAGGARRYRRALVGIARGNGKSTFGAAMALKGLAGEGVATPQVIGAGTDRENGGIIFRLGAGMVRQNRALLRRLRIIESTKRIVWRDGRGFYRVISADAQHAHGIHPSLLEVDDVQEMDREFFQVLSTSQGTISDPLMVMFMTAGFDQEGVGYEQWQHAEQVLEDPARDPELLPLLYAIGEKDDWTNPEVWKKANPNLGVTVTEASIREQVHKAQVIPSYQNTVLTYCFNRWVRQRTRWLSMESWDATGGLVDLARLAGRPCYVGVDLASTTDVAAVCYVFPSDTAEGPWDVLWDFFVPESVIGGRVARDKAPYDVFIAEGWLGTTPGNVISYDAIEDSIFRRAKTFRIQQIAFDPWQAQHFAQDMSEAGFSMVEVANTCRNMNLGTKETERLVIAGRLRHGGNHLARWMVDNVTILENSAGERKPDKRRSSEKIDGVVALVMAVGRAALQEDVFKGGISVG